MREMTEGHPQVDRPSEPICVRYGKPSFSDHSHTKTVSFSQFPAREILPEAQRPDDEAVA